MGQGPDPAQPSHQHTGPDGAYAFEGLSPGTYAITVTAPGFETFSDAVLLIEGLNIFSVEMVTDTIVLDAVVENSNESGTAAFVDRGLDRKNPAVLNSLVAPFGSDQTSLVDQLSPESTLLAAMELGQEPVIDSPLRSLDFRLEHQEQLLVQAEKPTIESNLALWNESLLDPALPPVDNTVPDPVFTAAPTGDLLTLTPSSFEQPESNPLVYPDPQFKAPATNVSGPIITHTLWTITNTP